MSPSPCRRPRTIPTLATLLLLLGTILLAGCTSSPAGPTGAWAADLSAHGQVGLEATLEATAGPAGGTLTGTGTATIDTPLTLRPETRGLRATPTIYFDASIPAIGSGILMLEGAQLNVTQGSLSGVAVTAVDAEDTLSIIIARTFGERADTAPFPHGFENESSDYFVANHIVADIRDWRVTGHERALWFQNGGAEELAGPFTFDATRMHWQSGSRMEASALQARFDRFAWASDEPSGTLQADTLGTRPVPLGVFGQDATLRLDGRDIESTGPFRLTQAVTPDGLLLDARVQLQPEHDTVVVQPDDTTWARVFFREHSYIGAAVLDDITVTGPGAELIKIPLAPPPLHIEALWDTLDEYPWFAQPFAALAFIAFSPFLLFADAFEGIACAFTTCPKDHPYPVWMEPGAYGGFYYQVSGDAPAGEYPATVTVHGANHAAVAFDVTIRVQAAET